jgi:thiol-disulfide isomerase/thioredoxin
MRFFLAVVLAASALWAGPNDCGYGDGARAALQEWRETGGKIPQAERIKALDELAAKYPVDFRVQKERQSVYRWTMREAWPGVREAYVQRALQNPNDPLSQTLGAAALSGSSTPRAIEMLTAVRTASPGYPWAALELAGIYLEGKFEDKDKARVNFDAYSTVCAEYLTSGGEWVMSKAADTAAQAAIGKRLRTRLEADPSPDPGDYSRLWAIEFRSIPPAQHPELRKQVAQDVERLLSLHPEKRHLETLLGGLKQSGASPESVTAFEERILREAPASSDAYQIIYDRWKKQHKEPEDHKDAAAWEAWKRDHLAATKQWVTQYTEVTWLKSSYLEARIDAGELSEKDAVRAIEDSLQKDLLRQGPDVWMYANPAIELLDKGWAPRKAYAWLEKAWPLAEEEDRAELDNDTLTDQRRKEIAEDAGYRNWVAVHFLRASARIGKKAVPASLRTYVEGPMPAKKASWSMRYRALAWLASVDGRDADALAYFQQSLFTRTKTPQYSRGKLEDRLKDEARAAFVKTGGTEKAFALWSQPAGKTQELAEGRWEKPTKTLPAFELADLSGRNWNLKQLEGKALLINLWATWCGPCRAELPHFQKLYEKTKDRTDIQVISFNVDDELGLVEPYMKEQKLTFPALAAFSLIRGMFDGYGIPQNWLVDPQGHWIATQLGYDSTDTDWVNSMVKRLEAAKQGKAPAGIQ